MIQLLTKKSECIFRQKPKCVCPYCRHNAMECFWHVLYPLSARCFQFFDHFWISSVIHSGWYICIAHYCECLLDRRLFTIKLLHAVQFDANLPLGSTLLLHYHFTRNFHLYCLHLLSNSRQHFLPFFLSFPESFFSFSYRFSFLPFNSLQKYILPTRAPLLRSTNQGTRHFSGSHWSSLVSCVIL